MVYIFPFFSETRLLYERLKKRKKVICSTYINLRCNNLKINAFKVWKRCKTASRLSHRAREKQKFLENWIMSVIEFVYTAQSNMRLWFYQQNNERKNQYSSCFQCDMMKMEHTNIHHTQMKSVKLYSQRFLIKSKSAQNPSTFYLQRTWCLYFENAKKMRYRPTFDE